MQSPKRTLLQALVAAIAAAGLVIATLAHAAPEVGKPAPAFTGTDSHGKRVSLADYRGKIVILEWTNHECPFVMAHYAGHMQQLQKEATAQGAIWLSVISSAPGKQGHVSPVQANELTQRRGAAPTAVILDADGSIGRAYGAKTTPHMYIVDAKGTLVYMGGIDDTSTTDPAVIPQSKNYVRAALAELAAGRSVSQPNTRPYGCSVKY